MATDLKTKAQSDLAAIISRQPSSVVSVIANAHTASAIRTTRVSEADLSDYGETGITASTVYCNADTIVYGSLTKGQTITVAGVSVFLLSFSIDPAGAVAKLEYSEQRPKS